MTTLAGLLASKSSRSRHVETRTAPSVRPSLADPPPKCAAPPVMKAIGRIRPQKRAQQRKSQLVGDRAGSLRVTADRPARPQETGDQHRPQVARLRPFEWHRLGREWHRMALPHHLRRAIARDGWLGLHHDLLGGCGQRRHRGPQWRVRGQHC